LEDFHQELESNEKIQEFVSDKFPEATFPVFGKSSLKNNVVYQSLKRQMPQHVVKHNFYKYLVNREGIAVKFFTKPQEPLSLKKNIEELLDTPIVHHHIVQ
jgi:glutathione peroxidase-family protein